MAVATSISLTGELVDTLDDLEALYEPWDELAVQNARPFCAPAWMLAWWRRMAGPNRILRSVAVRDGERLVAIAPMCAERRGPLTHYRFLASNVSRRGEPLAEPGLEAEAARVIAETLAAAWPRPSALHFEGVPVDSPWPGLLAEAWPGRRGAWVGRDDSKVAPAVTLAGRDYDAWFGQLPRKFRSSLRNRRRQLEAQGAQFRMAADPDEVRRGIDPFVRLHLARWEHRGGSHVLRPGIDGMLADAGAELVEEGRFRLWMIDVEGTTVSSLLFVAAGGELSYWLGGHDARFDRLGPSIQTLVVALEDAFNRHDRRMDLGPGAQNYKLRVADDEERLDWVAVLPRGGRYPLARLARVPLRLRVWASDRLPDGAKSRLRQILRRL